LEGTITASAKEETETEKGIHEMIIMERVNSSR
jgi:hypothetical protein